MRTKTIIIDMSNFKNIPPIPIKQFDNDIEFKIIIKDNGKEVNLNKWKAVLFIQDEHKNIYSYDCQVKDSIVLYRLNEDITQSVGKKKIEIRFTKGLDIVTTFPFFLDVIKAINIKRR